MDALVSSTVHRTLSAERGLFAGLSRIHAEQSEGEYFGQLGELFGAWPRPVIQIVDGRLIAGEIVSMLVMLGWIRHASNLRP